MHTIQIFTWIFILICHLIHSSDSSMNIARGGKTTQSSTYASWGSDKAVDGKILSQDVGCNCCSHTDTNKQTAWWQLDLENLSKIKNIKIYYRTQTRERLAGYFLYVTNSSRGRDTLCHRDPISRTLPTANQDLQCDYTARYIYIYNERLSSITYPSNYDRLAYLELCEVEVYGCPLGKYGDECNITCRNCKNESYICDPDSGNCVSGCKDDVFTGLQCNDCIAGLYGPDCDKNCSNGCVAFDCRGSDGVCNQGCKEGYTGSLCNVCVSSRYGDNCQKNCPINCFNHTCDDQSGDCIFGCEYSFNGSKCNECSIGLYGEMCDKNCSKGCASAVCEQTSGSCTYGCIMNFYGDSCDGCINGRYGTDCQYNCSSNCKSMQCHRSTGECVNGCSDGWEGVSCNVSISALMRPPEPPVEASTIAVAVIGVMLVLVAVLAVLIFMKRRSVGVFKKSRNDKEDIVHSSLDISSVKENTLNSQTPDIEPKKKLSNPAVKYDRNDIYENTAEIYYNMNIPGIPVREIKQYIAQKTKQDFEKEYKKLPDGANIPHIHASKLENKLKNRFQKSYCCDHSRVILAPLPDQPDSDYINANYIDRVDDQKCYIATQGPRVNTVNDFWRMVWEVNSSVIVMLTNLVEMGKVKCEQYWPEVGHTLDYGQYSISLKDVQEYVSFTLRKILITNTNDDSSRQILQFHFTTWPDHGTPDHTEIILFQRKIAAKYTKATGPMIVHCSAGIGRTGTFIALDALLEYGNRTGRIDILEYVKTMRKDRVNMVQAVEQYIFLNEVMAEAFDFEDTSLNRESIIDLFENQASSINTETLGSACFARIEKEFEDLQSKKKSYNDKDFKTALTKANRNKNKDNCPLALDQYRPFVNARLPNETNYINAVILPAFNRKDGYIVSHTPLPHTDIDIWSVIVDHQCKTLVIFNVDESEKLSRWLPLEEDEMEVGNFIIKKEVENVEIEHLKIYTFCISEKLSFSFATGQSLTKSGDAVTHIFNNALHLKTKAYIMSSWENKDLVSSKEQFKSLTELVDDWTRSRGSGTMTVLCPDGVTECGIFCVVCDVIGSFRANGEADIYQTVRQIQCRRPECIPSIEQYRFCYEVLYEYANSENVYANN